MSKTAQTTMDMLARIEDPYLAEALGATAKTFHAEGAMTDEELCAIHSRVCEICGVGA